MVAQVAVGDDPAQPAVVVHDRQVADPVLGQRAHGLVTRRVATDRDDVTAHDLGYSVHGLLSFFAAARSSGGTVSTGHGARRTTCSATLPRSRRSSPVRPWVPITIRSACSSVAAPTISCHDPPTRSSQRALTPCALTAPARSVRVSAAHLRCASNTARTWAIP